MGKTKQKAQNSNEVIKSIHGVKGGSVQKNKNPKNLKDVSSNKTTLINNLKLQNKNKPSQGKSQKTIDTNSNVNSHQNNKKELKGQSSLKRKHVLNKQNKVANKKSKLKELEVDDSDDSDDSDNFDESKSNEDSVEDSWVLPYITTSDSDSSELKNEPAKRDMKKILESEKIFSDESTEEEMDSDYDDLNSSDESGGEIDEQGFFVYEKYMEGKSEKEKKLIRLAKRILLELKEDRYDMPFPEDNGAIDRRAIKVENLPKDVTESDVRDKFGQFGSIKSFHFGMRVPSRYSKTKLAETAKNCPKHPLVVDIKAFITYDSSISATRAFSMNGKTLAGNYAIVSYLCPLTSLSSRCSKGVMLSNLPLDLDCNMLWKLFSNCGKIKYLYLHHSMETGLAEKSASIYFSTRDEANKAVELSGILVLDHAIQVKPGYPVRLRDEIRKRSAELARKFLKNKRIVKALIKDRAEQSLLYKWNYDEPSEQFKDFILKETIKIVNENQKSEKNVDPKKKKPTSLPDQEANIEQEKNTQFNKQKNQMGKKENLRNERKSF